MRVARRADELSCKPAAVTNALHRVTLWKLGSTTKQNTPKESKKAGKGKKNHERQQNLILTEN